MALVLLCITAPCTDKESIDIAAIYYGTNQELTEQSGKN
jgi:hypothetical protein